MGHQEATADPNHQKPAPPIQKKEAAEPQSLSTGLPKKKVRSFTFDIPASVRVGDHDPETVTLRELDDDDYKNAKKLGLGDRNQTGHEAVKLSLYEVDGVRVNHAEDQATWYWGRWSSKVRHILALGWAKIHTTDPGEDDAFLSSMRMG